MWDSRIRRLLDLRPDLRLVIRGARFHARVPAGCVWVLPLCEHLIVYLGPTSVGKADSCIRHVALRYATSTRVGAIRSPRPSTLPSARQARRGLNRSHGARLQQSGTTPSEISDSRIVRRARSVMYWTASRSEARRPLSESSISDVTSRGEPAKTRRTRGNCG